MKISRSLQCPEAGFEGSGAGKRKRETSILCMIPAADPGVRCAGWKRQGQAVEKSLKTIEETQEKLCDAADEERAAAFKRHAAV